MIINSLKYVCYSGFLFVEGRHSLEPIWSRTLLSWGHDLGYWGQYCSISRLLYELLPHNPLGGDLAATAAVAATAKPWESLDTSKL